MKKLLTLVFFSLLVNASYAGDDSADDKADAWKNFSLTLINIPGQMFYDINTSYLRGIQGVIEGIGKAFEETADTVSQVKQSSKVK